MILETLCALLALILIAYIYTIQYSYRNLPPGPFTLPIIGNFLELWAIKPTTFNLKSIKIWEYLHVLYKRYGDIFTISGGKFSGIMVCSYEIMNEMANMDEYSWKCSNDMTVTRTFGKELGLIFVGKTEVWTEMRKFSQRTLRDFGFGKRTSMCNVISDEITEIVQDLKLTAQANDGQVKIQTVFILSVLNVLWCMIAGKRYKHNDSKLVTMMERNFTMTKKQIFVDPIMLTFPWLYNTFPRFFGVTHRMKVFEECHAFSKSLIDERKAEGLYLLDPQNYIDCFLQKIHESKGKDESIYNEEQLQAMIEDFLQTGSVTTNGTLNYAVLFLMLNPAIQEKCQQEIDTVVSRDFIPTLEDIEKMPYFQATILEVHRLGSVVPTPIPRMLQRDWNFRGYHIPKDTYIVSNHYSVMMDEKYWGDPHVFRPERFIDSNGKFVKDKHVVHYGFGKRNCIGVTLANSVIPIYIATLLQNFSFSVIPGTKEPSTEAEIGVSLSPFPFSTLLTIRNCDSNNNKL